MMLGVLVAWDSLLGQDLVAEQGNTVGGLGEQYMTCCSSTVARQCVGCYEWFIDCAATVNRGICLYQDEGQGPIPACAFINLYCHYQEVLWTCSLS